jgi:multiple antibiotic resistance protein
MLDLAIAAFVAFFVTIDPPGLGPLFLSITAGADGAFRRRMALKGSLIAASILFGFAFGGNWLLMALGIGLPAFRIAGGVLLLLLALDMVIVRPSGLRSTTPGENIEASQRLDISVFPLAIPLIAGPGAMTTTVLLMGQNTGNASAQIIILAVLLLVLGLALLVLLFAHQVTRFLGVTGTNVIGRVLGILLVALAVQFIVDGLSAAWPKLFTPG